jgi:tetratricopeptide (TPR) repeat protein
MATAAPPSQRWLYGPIPDLLLGAGVAYALFFVLQAAAGAGLRQLVPYSFAPLVLLVSGTPHYGATLLRVYERREDRRAYAFFAVWVTIAMAALFAVGAHSALVGSLLLTLMLTWSPWHYTGQNYGIALMFLRRRGVSISPALKRTIYASFVLSFVLTFLAVHGAAPGGQYAPTPYEGTAYRFISLGIPDSIRLPAFAVVGLAYAASVVAAAVMALRVASPRDLLPAAVLVGTQALWFSVPTLVRYHGVLQGIEPLALQHAQYSFVWVGVGHSLQYLWITSYYARHREPGLRPGGYLAKTLLAGAALWSVPALLFAPGLLGRVPFDDGLELLVSATVNLHHFILDGAIWKLRDGRIARILIRSATGDAEAPAAIAPARRFRLGPLVWVVGAACAAMMAWAPLEHEFGVRRASQRDDADRIEHALTRLSRVGRDSAQVRAALGVALARQGRFGEAVGAAESGLALHPSPEAWRALALVYQMAGRPTHAISAYREALRLRSGWPEVENNLAWMLATHPSPQIRNPGEALQRATRAAQAIGAREPNVLDTLAAAYAASRRFDLALRVAAQARESAAAAGDEALAREIEARMALYAEHRPYVETPARPATAAPPARGS